MKKLKPNHDEGMWKGAPSDSFSKAQFLRRNETIAEKLLWEKLRNNQLEGLKFRRQHPVNIYIADFYCHKFKLIIELDGDYHNQEEQKQKDEVRTEVLGLNDLKIIRFKNEEVEQDINQVLITIKNKIEQLKEK
ncbi:endonuclease domain-containing protein [Cloacibacterium normanense]|jgi:very-short-patch-repair endonuclease|uniref:endonuclease domain-containing protein n=1 Tax=Cloacibacterium normanense TaxID=237258 RepID=UPI00352E161C